MQLEIFSAYSSKLVSDLSREPTLSIAFDYNFQRITSSGKGICEMPSMNADFADVGSSIFAGPTAISRKKKPVLVLETSEK